MDDSISRQAAIKELESGKDKKLPSAQPEVDCQKCIFCGFPGFKQFQTAPPEIIRCKDCRYDNHCAIQTAARTGNTFFCGAAKRREE